MSEGATVSHISTHADCELPVMNTPLAAVPSNFIVP